jgi:hypothetical protein
MFPFFASSHLPRTAILRCAKRAKGVRHMKDSILVVLLFLGTLFVIVYDLFAFVGM